MPWCAGPAQPHHTGVQINVPAFTRWRSSTVFTTVVAQLPPAEQLTQYAHDPTIDPFRALRVVAALMLISGP